GLWWLRRAEAAAHRAGKGYGPDASVTADRAAADELVRERATTAREFDPAEIHHGHRSDSPPPVLLAALPLIVVASVNPLMSRVLLPRLDFSYLAEERWGATSISGVAGVWSVVVGLAAAIAVVILCNRSRLPSLRQSMDAGANASVLPGLSVASLVGFGAVIATRRLSQSCAIGCWEYRVAHSSHSLWRRMSSLRSLARLPAD